MLPAVETIDRYELEQQVAASRRTVVRTLEQFHQRGYLRRTDDQDGYVLTAFGEHIANSFRQSRDVVGTLSELKPFLTRLDTEQLGFDPTVLEDPTLTVTTDIRPYAVLDRLIELRATAAELQMAAMKFELRSLEQLQRRVMTDGSLSATIILSAPVFEQARSDPAYREAYQQVRDTATVQLFVYPDPLEYMVGIIDDTAVIGVRDGGTPYALLETEHQTAIDWVDQRLTELQSAATPLSEY